MVVGAQGGPAGGSSLQKAWARVPGGAGGPIQAVVGAQGGPVGGSSSQWPGHFNPGGRGVLPRLWLVLNEGLWGVAVPNGPGTPAWGDGESCRGGGQCSRRACGGLQFPTAGAHQPGGTGRLAQVVISAQGGPVGASSSKWSGNTNPGGWGDLPRWWSALKEGLRGAAVSIGPGTPAWEDRGSYPGAGQCSRRARGG